MELVKVIIGHKEAFVYPDEASNLISKGLACYPDEMKAVVPSENKMIEPEYEDKAEIYWDKKQPKKKAKK